MQDDKTHHQDRLRANPHLAGRVLATTREGDGGEGACPAFGYLRGLHERANAIEFRFRSGNSHWFPYTWMGNWQFNPSEGLLLKFSGDQVYLVLIRGSNLDKAVNDSGIDLIRAGLQRHRVLWIREMSEDESRQTSNNGPTVDAIEVGEFASQDAMTTWLKSHCPSFDLESADS